jgi:hypothetical protein
VLERHAATCGLHNPLRAEWFNSVFGYFGIFLAPVKAVGGGFRAPGVQNTFSDTHAGRNVKEGQRHVPEFICTDPYSKTVDIIDVRIA